MFSRIANIDIIDHYTIKLSLDFPYPSFLALLAGPMAKIYKRRKIGYPLGTGAFRVNGVAQRGSRSILELSRFEDYHARTPHIISIELWELLEDEAIELAQRGVIHDTSIYPSRSGYAQDSKIMVQLNAPAISTWLFSFNMEALPTSDAGFRKCFVGSFNKKEFVNRFLKDHGVAEGFLPPILGGSLSFVSQGKGSCEKYTGRRVRIDMPEEVSRSGDMCQYIVREYRKLKINVECNIIPFSEIVKKIKGKNFEMAFLAQTLDIPDIEYFFHTFEKSSVLNISNYTTKFILGKLKRARLEQEESQKLIYYNEINQHLYVNNITLNVSFPRQISYFHRCIESLDISTFGENFINYRVVKLKKYCDRRKDFSNVSK